MKKKEQAESKTPEQLMVDHEEECPPTLRSNMDRRHMTLTKEDPKVKRSW